MGAVSVGIVGGEALLDLDYAEDAAADVDMNVVMTGEGRLIEVQATAEGAPFGRARLDALVDLAAGDRRDRRAYAGRQSRAGNEGPARLPEPEKAAGARAMLPGWEVEPADTSGWRRRAPPSTRTRA